MELATTLTRKTRSLVEGYTDDPETPLGGYATLVGVFTVTFGSLLAGAALAGKLPRRWSVRDVALLGVATHKLSRIVTRDWVTAPLRAPFTRYERNAGSGEVVEKSRGRGLRRAIGDLVTCPYCSGPWVAGALGALFVAAPRAGRAVAAVLATVAVSDWLHHAHAKLTR